MTYRWVPRTHTMPSTDDELDRLPRATARLLFVTDGDTGDDERIATAIVELLRRQGYIVERCADVEHALMIAQASSPALALVEVRPGERGGIAVMEALHRLSPRMPVL